MGWSIFTIDNTVEITDECAKDLFDAQEYENEIWYDIDNIAYDGVLYFEIDHMEHMDFLSNEHITDVLKKNKVEGLITFGSGDGDNAGEFWGYRFDGKGGMDAVTGVLHWESDLT